MTLVSLWLTCVSALKIANVSFQHKLIHRYAREQKLIIDHIIKRHESKIKIKDTTALYVHIIGYTQK